MSTLTNINTSNLRHMGMGAAMMLFMATEANAHHAMDGQTPVTFAQGFISGIAHPVIGLDHFIFLLIAAVLAFTLSGVARYVVPLLFVAATLGGTVFHLADGNIPFAETLVALSVLGAGIIAVTRKSLGAVFLGAVFAVSGVFHGYAYGEAIVGAETGPLLAYLIGFSVIQYLIIGAVIRAFALQATMTRLGSSLAILSGGLFMLLSIG